ncbi:MAG: hypothetical protein U1E21_01315 [Reyranellaceae bacterium]
MPDGSARAISGFARWLCADEFARRHPTPSIVVARLARGLPFDQESDAGYLALLVEAMQAIGCVGDFSAFVHLPTAIVRFAFARRQDAALLCAFTQATPDEDRPDAARLAWFPYDRALHDRLLALRHGERDAPALRNGASRSAA